MLSVWQKDFGIMAFECLAGHPSGLIPIPFGLTASRHGCWLSFSFFLFSLFFWKYILVGLLLDGWSLQGLTQLNLKVFEKPLNHFYSFIVLKACMHLHRCALSCLHSFLPACSHAYIPARLLSYIHAFMHTCILTSGRTSVSMFHLIYSFCLRFSIRVQVKIQSSTQLLPPYFRAVTPPLPEILFDIQQCQPIVILYK